MKLFSTSQTFAFLQSFHSNTPTSSSSWRMLPLSAGMSTTTAESFENATKAPINSTIADENIPLLSKILPPLAEGSRRIYLLRHGETDWNKLGKIQGGGFDIELNDNGRQQALNSALALDDIPLEVVASSHLSRAKETADILWHRHDATVQGRRVIFEGLGEMRFGEFEGLAWRDEETDPALEKRFKEISKSLKEDPDKSFPGGGESTNDVRARAVAAVEQILRDFPRERHIAIVSHGRTNKVIIASTALGDVMKYPTVKQGSKFTRWRWATSMISAPNFIQTSHLY